MGKIAIVYWSGTGNTEAMANFVAEGAGGQADLFTPGEFSADLVSTTAHWPSAARPWAPSSWRRPNLSPCSRR